MTQEKKQTQQPQMDQPGATAEETTDAVTEEIVAEEAEKPQEISLEEELQAKLKQEQDNYLRLAAEYDNFRKRNQKEREALYNDVQAETVAKFLPVYDNLARAMATQTADEAYKKGVEMTMAGLKEVLQKIGVTAFGQVGDTFDPNRHNAVMHVEDESQAENTVMEVFQEGFQLGEKIIRFAMVKVAN